MNFELFQNLSDFPYIWDLTKYDGKKFSQNKHCLKCKKMDCCELLNSKASEHVCERGFNSYVVELKEGKAIVNGLISSDNKIIKSGRRDARLEYLVQSDYIKKYISDFGMISKAIDNGIKNNIKDNFTLFHDVRSSYGIAFSNLESLIFEQPGNSFYDKLQNCDQKLVDLYDSLDLVNSLLDLIDVMVNPAAIVQGTKREMNIFKLTHKLTKLFGVKSEKRNLTFEIYANNQIPSKLYHDSIKLIPIILIENAIKYSERNNKIVISFLFNNPEITGSISSYGYPIPIDERERVFEKQFRGKNSKAYTTEGIGMGLYIAKSILLKHNGDIHYTFEEKGRGMGFNIFTFTM